MFEAIIGFFFGFFLAKSIWDKKPKTLREKVEELLTEKPNEYAK